MCYVCGEPLGVEVKGIGWLCQTCGEAVERRTQERRQQEQERRR